MFPSISSISEATVEPKRLRESRYGVIEVVSGELVEIRFRHWPKTASRFGIWWSRLLGRHRNEQKDRCLLFYNSPRRCPGFLTLPFIESGRRATIATVFAALDVLDAVARLKEARAIVCEIANPRISDRLLARRGFERHLPNSNRRHFIKRFDT